MCMFSCLQFLCSLLQHPLFRCAICSPVFSFCDRFFNILCSDVYVLLSSVSVIASSTSLFRCVCFQFLCSLLQHPLFRCAMCSPVFSFCSRFFNILYSDVYVLLSSVSVLASSTSSIQMCMFSCLQFLCSLLQHSLFRCVSSPVFSFCARFFNTRSSDVLYVLQSSVSVLASSTSSI